MECQTALEQLECVRPDSDDLDLPELAEARLHLQSCDSCAEKFTAMQVFDRSVSSVAVDVEVPDWLRASLLGAAVAETVDSEESDTEAQGADNAAAEADSVTAKEGTPEDAESEPDVIRDPRLVGEADSEEPSKSPRRMMHIAIAAACGLLVATTALLWNSGPVQFAEADLLQRLPLDLSETSEFDAGFKFAVPATWSANHRIRVGQELRGLSLDEEAGHEAAIAIFRFSPGRAAPVSGILAAVPSSRVQPLPVAASFQSAAARYVQKNGRRPVAAVWQERDTVYVCFVLGSAADLERIQRSLNGSAA